MSSLIDPNPPQQAPPRVPQPSITSNPVSPPTPVPKPAPAPAEQPPAQPQPTTEMEIDRPTVQPKPQTSSSKASAAGSNAPTPPATTKAARQKEAAPMPTGSGLLSGTPMGIVAAVNGAKTEGTNIWLTFPILGQENVTINFAREVERKYGFAALHPRLAAHQERLRAVAAAGAALEREQGVKGDDVSVDMSDVEDGSDVQMGGTEEGEQPKKKKRRRKEEEYDKDDDFIDDTELAWEEQALQAKDGFFVYSGPLVPPESVPSVERYVKPSFPLQQFENMKADLLFPEPMVRFPNAAVAVAVEVALAARLRDAAAEAAAVVEVAPQSASPGLPRRIARPWSRKRWSVSVWHPSWLQSLPRARPFLPATAHQFSRLVLRALE